MVKRKTRLSKPKMRGLKVKGCVGSGANFAQRCPWWNVCLRTGHLKWGEEEKNIWNLRAENTEYLKLKTKENMQFKYKHSIHSTIDCYVSVRNNVIHNRRRKIIFMKMSVKQKKINDTFFA